MRRVLSNISSGLNKIHEKLFYNHSNRKCKVITKPFVDYYLKQLQSCLRIKSDFLVLFFLRFLCMFIIFAQNNPRCCVLIGFPHGWESSVQTLRAEWPSILAGFNLLTVFFSSFWLSFYFESTGLSGCYFLCGLRSLGAFWHDCCKSWGE